MELLTSDEQIPLIEHYKSDFDPKCTFYTKTYRYNRKSRIEKYQCVFFTILLSMIFLMFFGTAIYSVQKNVFNDSTLNANESTILNTEINSIDLSAAYDFSFLLMSNLIELEKNLSNMSISSPTYKHQKSVFTTKTANHIAKLGFIEQSITEYLTNSTNQSINSFQKSCGSYFVNWPFLREQCISNTYLNCSKITYRSFNGSCNNLHYPNKYGVAFNPFRRVLYPSYADGIGKPRKAVDGLELPSARNVSLFVHRPSYKSDVRFTVMFAVFGQFLDHDITATALSQTFAGKPISCCDNNISDDHPNCYPIKVSKEDDYYRDYNVSCVDFSRSASAFTCSLGPREQLNQASSFIDGSTIYNSEDSVVKRLRANKKGLLKMLSIKNRSLLPISDDKSDGCNREEMNRRGRYCFMTGDGRANENLHLTTLHLIWARHHNYLALNLLRVNPHWDDETLFQESRRILIAQLQHITYNEFLSILLGDNVMKMFRLRSQKSGYFHDYDYFLDPSIANNFAAASFRFAHTLIPGLIKMINRYQNSTEDVELHKILFNPYKLYDADGIDAVILGAIQTNIEPSDTYFSKELKDHLFETDVKKSNKTAEEKPFFKPCGLDLVTLNIQRGRDHGLPSYPSWRQFCGFKKPNSFSDLTNILNQESLKLISTIYKSVDDIDLYTGALSEIIDQGNGLLGPTLTCLISDQFKRLKFGDRYWYETSTSPQAYSLRQLDSIRKTKLATIFCDNSDHIGHISLNVMEQNSESNPIVNCSELPRLNFLLWIN